MKTETLLLLAIVGVVGFVLIKRMSPATDTGGGTQESNPNSTNVGTNAPTDIFSSVLGFLTAAANTTTSIIQSTAKTT